MALTIAGCDSSGGAGVVADCSTFVAHGMWPAVAITALTAQSTRGVDAVELVAPEMVRAQMESVAQDLGVDGAKTGMLGGPGTVEAVAAALVDLGIGPLVVDPVMVATSGARLTSEAASKALRQLLLPLADVVTPNVAEAQVLTGIVVRDRTGAEAAGRRLLELGARAVLLTGGHLDDPEGCADLLMSRDDRRWLVGPRLRVAGTHGSGCVLSAALCALLAGGADLLEAAAGAKEFAAAAVAAAVAPGRAQGASVDPAAVHPHRRPGG